MKHMLIFQTEAEYEAALPTFDLPVVAKVRETGNVHFLADDPNYFRLDEDDLDSDKYIK